MMGPELHCLRCNYSWVPRTENPRRCPRCKSYQWRTPKKHKSTEHIMVSETPKEYSIGELIKNRLREG